MPPLKAAFLGQKAIAASCLDLLLEARNRQRIEITILCSEATFQSQFRERIDAPPVMLPNNARGTAALLAAMATTGTEALLSVQHPWVLPAAVLDATTRGAFNLHNARLPDYCGHGSISHAILQGDTTYATTIHWMVPEVDRGHIVCGREVSISAQETARSLYDKPHDAAVHNFGHFLELLLGREAVPRIPMRPGGRFYGKDSLAPPQSYSEPRRPRRNRPQIQGVLFSSA